MSRFYLDDARTSFHRSGFPLTISLIVIKFLMMALSSFGVPLAMFFVFVAPQSWQQPWRALTYPFVAFDIMEVLFSGIALYFFAGSLERSWGTKTFAIFLAAISVATALGLTLGTVLSGGAINADSWLIVAAIVVAWGTINKFESVLLWFFPVQGRWLAVIDVAIIFFTYVVRFSFWMAICALAGCAASYLWVSNRVWYDVAYWTLRKRPKNNRPPNSAPRPQLAKTKRRHDDDFSWRDLNPFERIARAKRKKQFERLFEDDKK